MGQPPIVVPGHGNLGGTEIATQVLDYFKETRKLVAERKSNKTRESAVVKQLEPIVQNHIQRGSRMSISHLPCVILWSYHSFYLTTIDDLPSD